MTDVRTRLASALEGRYTLERELGGGGMARVFLAEELALGRKVVVKLLPPELGLDVGADRFRREIQLAARLQHPQVVPVLATGEADGLPYYTMPYIEGDSLRARVEAGPLPLREIVSVLRDVARALAFAHERGVVHRDIKPDNVLLAGGSAVVTDFGIAKAVSAARDDGGATLTQLGMAVGTPAYIAPEQAAGDPATDHRADLYAFGCLAYELACGAPPFTGRSPQATLAAHLVETPAPLDERSPGTPPSLAELVGRCLAKDPADRPQSAAELLTALEAVAVEATPSGALRAAVPPPHEPPSIAVLPFANLGSVEDEYFADGLTDELITDLSGVRPLRVIARGAVMRLKGTELGLDAIARELSVRYVLEGSVRRAGPAIRITARLVDARDLSSVWTDKLSGTLEDVFAMQEQVSRTIVEALRLVLTQEDERRLAHRPIEDPRTYESYLKARHEMWACTRESLDRARRLLQNALDLVGDNALLLSTLGHVHLHALDLGLSTDDAELDRAEGYLQRAHALPGGTDSAFVHRLQGWVHFKRGAMGEAIASLERARVLSPGDADGVVMLTYAYLMTGQDARAAEASAEALALDPLTPLVQCMPGFAHWMRGEFAQAVPYYRTFHRMEPDSPMARWFLCWILGHAGAIGEAQALAESLERDFAGTAFAAIARAFERALHGDAAGAEAAITPDLRAAADHAEFFARGLADCWGILGRTDEMLDCLEAAVRQGFGHRRYLETLAPFLEPVRSRPRFRALLERLAPAPA